MAVDPKFNFASFIGIVEHLNRTNRGIDAEIWSLIELLKNDNSHSDIRIITNQISGLGHKFHRNVTESLRYIRLIEKYFTRAYNTYLESRGRAKVIRERPKKESDKEPYRDSNGILICRHIIDAALSGFDCPRCGGLILSPSD